MTSRREGDVAPPSPGEGNGGAGFGAGPIRAESGPPGVRTLVVDRPGVLNALDREALERLGEAIEEAVGDREVRALVLRGGGERAFVAGSDLGWIRGLDAEGAREFSRLGQRVASLLEEAPIPVLIAARGYALGSGMELVLAADLVHADETAVFGLPELGLGVVPGHGGTARLAARVGFARAADWLLTGRRVSAREAMEAGLVCRVHAPERLLAETTAAAEALARKSRGALAAAKGLLRAQRAAAFDMAAALARETETFAGMFGTADQIEGMSAFLEKRPPRFA